jgi:hypothetical protein
MLQLINERERGKAPHQRIFGAWMAHTAWRPPVRWTEPTSPERGTGMRESHVRNVVTRGSQNYPSRV